MVRCAQAAVVGAIVLGCSDAPTIPEPTSESPALLPAVRLDDVNRQYTGQMVISTVAFDTNTGESALVRSDTSSFRTVNETDGTIHGEVEARGAGSGFILRVADASHGGPRRWDNARAPRQEGVVAGTVSDVPPETFEFTDGSGRIRTKVTNEWARTAVGWVLAKTTTVITSNHHPILKITREVVSASAIGPAIASAANHRVDPAAPSAQATADCCTSEHNNVNDALTTMEWTYVAMVAACATTGLAGCAVGAIFSGGASVNLQTQLDRYNECVLYAVANADCETIAGW